MKKNIVLLISFFTISIFCFSQQNYVPNVMVTTLAGYYNSAARNGQDTLANFNLPADITVDIYGNAYIADAGNNQIRKITPTGLVSTLAGSLVKGSSNGQGTAASFFNPSGIAVDKLGNVYVADTYNNLIRKINPNGLVSTLAGSTKSGNVNGQDTAARFNNPIDLVVDDSGNVYVTDQNYTIRKIKPDGSVSSFGNLGISPGSNITIDISGNIYVGNSIPNQIDKISPDGSLSTVSIPSNTNLFISGGLTIDKNNNIYMLETDSYEVIKITATGIVSIFAGSGHRGCMDGQGVNASFNKPTGISIDGSGNLYVADTYNNEIRKITPNGYVTTLAGSTTASGRDGQDSAASFNFPSGVAVDSSGNVFVADYLNNEIRKITPNGYVTTLAGCDTSNYIDRDGKGTDARVGEPVGIAVNDSGIVYVSTFGYGYIKKITPDTFVTTWAIPKSSPYLNPVGIAVDDSGNAYVADWLNNMIRKIFPDGSIGILAGSGAQGNKNGKDTASFYWPEGVAVDDSGNVYVGDTYNNMIRKITPNGYVTTLAGSIISGNIDGQGKDARFNGPKGLVLDDSGNVYVADGFNNEIRKITPSGLVSTIAGSPTSGNTDGQGKDAQFNLPYGIAIDSKGNLYVADAQNNEIRKITLNTPTLTLSTINYSNSSASITVFPNPATDILNIILPQILIGTLSILDVQGSVVINQAVNTKELNLSTTSLQNGMYVLKIVSEKDSYINKIIIAR